MINIFTEPLTSDVSAIQTAHGGNYIYLIIHLSPLNVLLQM